MQWRRVRPNSANDLGHWLAFCLLQSLRGLNVVDRTNERAAVHCLDCLTEYPAPARFCMSCGQPLRTSPPAADVPAPPTVESADAPVSAADLMTPPWFAPLTEPDQSPLNIVFVEAPEVAWSQSFTSGLAAEALSMATPEASIPTAPPAVDAVAVVPPEAIDLTPAPQLESWWVPSIPERATSNAGPHLHLNLVQPTAPPMLESWWVPSNLALAIDSPPLPRLALVPDEPPPVQSNIVWASEPAPRPEETSHTGTPGTNVLLLSRSAPPEGAATEATERDRDKPAETGHVSSSWTGADLDLPDAAALPPPWWAPPPDPLVLHALQGESSSRADANAASMTLVSCASRPTPDPATPPRRVEPAPSVVPAPRARVIYPDAARATRPQPAPPVSGARPVRPLVLVAAVVAILLGAASVWFGQTGGHPASAPPRAPIASEPPASETSSSASAVEVVQRK